MTKFNKLMVIFLALTGVALISISATKADDNPFLQQNDDAESSKPANLSQGMCGMGRCGRCGRCGGCGGGMMWRGNGKPKIGDITELPKPQSLGAKLVNKYCTQCHALPDPKLHSEEGWNPTIERMNARMKWMKSNGRGVNAPDEKELEALTNYLLRHSK